MPPSSAWLAYIAHRALEDRMVAVLADSPSLSRREIRAAVAFAEKHRIPLKVVHTKELEDPFYQANQGNRCYYCKKELFEKLKELREQLIESLKDSVWPLFYGMNQDDLGDHRPGHEAAKEADIQAPYVEHGVDKNAIRSICSFYGLDIADKPAMPCLATRIAYGQTITPTKLQMVAEAEAFLHRLGLRQCRVRHHGDLARIEVPADRIAELMQPATRDRIERHLRQIGYTFVAMDLRGFRSGSMNEAMNTRSDEVDR